MLSGIISRLTSDNSNENQNYPVWKYDYPVINNEVTNAALTRFQHGIINLKLASEGNCYEDFTRTFALNGRKFSAETDKSVIMTELHRFIDSAKGYGSDAAAKTKLKEYMSTRGGQDHDVFIQHLVNSNHFLNNSVNGECSLSQKPTSANWTINKNGKIELNIATQILSLEFKHPGSTALLSLIAEGREELACFVYGCEEFIARRNNGLSPLMEITAKIQLEIRNGIVMPVVTQLHVDGYNKKIQVHPDNILNIADERNLNVIKILNLVNTAIQSFSDDMTITNTLMKIKHFVEQGSFGDDINGIKHASQCIEKIVCYFYPHFYSVAQERTTMLEQLENDNDLNEKFIDAFGISINQQANRSYHAIPGDVFMDDKYNRSTIVDTFGKIYLRLQQHLHHYQPISSYQYPVTPPGVIDAEFYQKWLPLASKSDPFDKRMLNDFKLRCKIRNQRLDERSNDKTLLDALDALINESNLKTDNDKNTLLEWIKANRHKSSDLLTKLIMQHHEVKIAKSNATMFAPANNLQHTIKLDRECAEWDVDIDGNIALTTVYYVHGIENQRTNTIGVKNMQTKTLVFNLANDVANKNVPPIIRIESKISFAVKDGQVTPLIKLLKIDSYNKDVSLLRCPPEERRAPIRRLR